MVLTERENLSFEYKEHELDNLLCHRASVSTIEQFFSDNQDNIVDIIRKSVCCNLLFSLDFINAVDVRFLKPICKSLLYRDIFDYEGKMRQSASVIMSNWITAEKRAVFWNVMRRVTYPFSGVPYEMFARDLFVDNEYARRSYLRYGHDANKRAFIKNTETTSREFNETKDIMVAIRQDNLSIFEMNRQLSGKNITITMLLYLLRHDAIKCFLHLLTYHTKQVYQCRTAEEWLFTVCRCLPASTATPIIQWIETDNPGIVANARDPWGNTLLWNTLANRNRMDKVQETLISLGCNPDETNQWDLSFRFVQENKLEK